MNYYIDTEFHEYHKQVKACGIPIGKPIPTIDLISIGIVSKGIIIPDNINQQALQNGSISLEESLNKTTSREYYAISKDFNIKDAWNSWQWNKVTDETLKLAKSKARRKGFNYNHAISTIPRGRYWLRENVLKPIFKELLILDYNNYKLVFNKAYHYDISNTKEIDMLVIGKFNYKNFKKLINKYGKTNKQIAKEIKEFIAYSNNTELHPSDYVSQVNKGNESILFNDINLYAYYADYDWVVFCQLFGKMIDLPKGFPRYCKDLKQELDNKQSILQSEFDSIDSVEELANTLPPINIKHMEGYPKQSNKHNALDDAKWNKELHNFINSL